VYQFFVDVAYSKVFFFTEAIPMCLRTIKIG